MSPPVIIPIERGRNRMADTAEVARSITERIRHALEDRDFTLLRPVLADDATWASCVGGAQIVDWMQGALAQGVECTLKDVTTHEDRVVLALEVAWPDQGDEPSTSRSYFQVLFLRDGKIVELQDVETREEALSAVPAGPVQPSDRPSDIDRMAVVLPVRDLARAMEHYESLGFEVRRYEGGGYGYADRAGASFHFGVVSDLDPRRNTSAVYLYVEDADALLAEWRASGVTGQFFEPTDTDYGLREGAHVDLDGNLIRFGSPLEGTATFIGTEDPMAVAATQAIHTGDVDGLRQVLAEHPELVNARLGTRGPDGMSRTLLHVATDWPGHYPNGAAIVAALVEAGADVDARFAGGHTETPLHWAASSDDVEVLDALLDAGADIEARGAVIGGGTPLADATAFGQWNVARRLIERGANSTLWEASALGLMDRIQLFFDADPGPSDEDVTHAFWSACHGGQLQAAEYLLERGANINWKADWDGCTPFDAARREGANEIVAWLHHRGGRSAAELHGS
jgi:uncharacterized protein